MTAVCAAVAAIVLFTGHLLSTSSEGGSEDPSNCRTLCHRCHAAR